MNELGFLIFKTSIAPFGNKMVFTRNPLNEPAIYPINTLIMPHLIWRPIMPNQQRVFIALIANQRYDDRRYLFKIVTFEDFKMCTKNRWVIFPFTIGTMGGRFGGPMF